MKEGYLNSILTDFFSTDNYPPTISLPLSCPALLLAPCPYLHSPSILPYLSLFFTSRFSLSLLLLPSTSFSVPTTRSTFGRSGADGAAVINGCVSDELGCTPVYPMAKSNSSGLRFRVWQFTGESSAAEYNTPLMVLLFILFVPTLAATPVVQRIAAATTALYAFGDSTTDVGNFLPEDNPMSKNPPYGIDYPGGTPTGRASNGFLMVDYIAKAMELLKSPPAFRAITNEQETIRGVNFASSGSGILNTTGENVIPLDEQIEDFKKIAANLTARVGDCLASIRFNKSLFYFSVGNNDVFAQFIARRPVNDTQKDQIVALITNKFRDQSKTLYKLGARKFAVSGTGLVGCSPMARVLLSPYLDCIDDLNDLSRRLTNSIKTMLENLSVMLEGFKYSFANFYEFRTQAMANPSAYGFTVVKSACCGGGRLNAEVDCGAANTTCCSDRTQYFFWDNVHPTEAFYKLLAQVALTESPPLVTPVNVGQLILTIKSQLHAEQTASA